MKMDISAAGHVPATHNNEYLDLKKYVIWVLATLLPLTVLTITIGILSHSLSIFSIALENATSVMVHIFNIITIIIILRQNSFNFPYGTGKLENFSGFLYAIIVIPITLVIINSAVNRYLNPPATINLGLAQVPLVLGTIRACIFTVWASRICKRYPDHSPLTFSYFISLKLTLILNLSIVAGLLIGLWMQSSGYLAAAVTADLIIAVAVALYMLYSAVGVLVKNFKSLIDLPLPETEQYKILNALVMDFDAYEGIGNIYSQLSGSNRFIQIELHFDKTTTVEEIENLRLRIDQRLREHFSKLVFHLIPLAQKNASDE